MNSTTNPEAPVVAYCRVCGKALTMETQRLALGSVYCPDHVPAPVSSPYQVSDSPYTAPAPVPPVATGTSPGLAFLLGLIPGVGAVYNGQYAKGLVHVIIFGLLISTISSGSAHGLEALFGMVIGLFYFYMAFEAYHTARKHQIGQPVDEFSSLLPIKTVDSGLPIGPIVLIALGVLFLLNSLEIVRFYQIMKYWPVFLIILGAYMLYVRTIGSRSSSSGNTEIGDEPR